MRIFLRERKESDGKLIVKWRNSPKILKRCFNKEQITEKSDKHFFHEKVKSGLYKQYIVERTEEMFGVISYAIATVYLKDIDKKKHKCELCIFTSDDEEWNSDSQLLAIKMLLKICFEEMDMQKVYSYIFAEFEDERILLEKAGLKVEEILEKGRNFEYEYRDIYRMAISKDEYFKLLKIEE